MTATGFGWRIERYALRHVACSRCGAEPGERCHTKSGAWAPLHSARLAEAKARLIAAGDGPDMTPAQPIAWEVTCCGITATVGATTRGRAHLLCARSAYDAGYARSVGAALRTIRSRRAAWADLRAATTCGSSASARFIP